MTTDANVIRLSPRPERRRPARPLIPPWAEDASTASCDAAVALLLPTIRALARLARQRAVFTVGD